MIKSNDPKSATLQTGNSCFRKSEHGPGLGISFEKKDGRKQFALYSFLSAVDFNRSTELIFHYTFGSISVKGESLQPLWDHICAGTLVQVFETEHSSQESPLIHEIVFADLTIPSGLEPPFPA
jgi:hypothetical protein